MTSHAIELANVSCAYHGAPVLTGVSLRVPPGQFVGMIGPSGAGKTTLLRAMLGLVPRVSGQVVVAGRAVLPGRPPSGVGYVPQVETVDWTFPVTVENVVLMGKSSTGRWLPWPSRQDRRDVAAILDRLGIGDLASRHIRDLSGGQQQRTFLARALIGRPRILFLDEPTASVDIKTRDDILHLLVQINQEEGVTIVMTTHELNAVAAHLPWVVCVNGGIVAQGAPSSVFTSAILSRTFGTEMRVVLDEHTGNLLVAEAGSHGPFGRRATHGHLRVVAPALPELPLPASEQAGVQSF
jgi:zinc/manganese transport system ATP-binding protein/zinc transport system ATP-binding protein